MRITGGEFRGIPLQAPKGPGVRPTLDHVRQAIFNLIGESVAGATVLELFSGSGALGLEAISRGAAHVTFVDRSYFSTQAIKENLRHVERFKPERPWAVVRSEAVAAIQKLGRERAIFDLILMDPPYEKGLLTKSLNALTQYVIVSQAGHVVVEHEKNLELPARLEGKGVTLLLQRQKRYGDTAVSLYASSLSRDL